MDMDDDYRDDFRDDRDDRDDYRDDDRERERECDDDREHTADRRERERSRERSRDRGHDRRRDERRHSRSPRHRSRSRDRDHSGHRGRDDRDRDRDTRGRSRSRDRSRRRDDSRERDRSRTSHRDRDHGRERDRHDERDREREDRERDRERAERERERERSGRHGDSHDLYRPSTGGGGGRARSRSPPPRGGRRFSNRSGAGSSRGGASGAGPMNAPAAEAEAHARVSKRQNRLYVGNLSYECRYLDLQRFMEGAGGRVVFSEVLVTPAGTSKGCGIVEFETTEQARRAMSTLHETPFMGRAVFIREDRELAPRFGVPPIPGKIGLANGEARSFLGGHAAPPTPGNRNIFVGNLPAHASWQDLKDLMRQAGEVVRADVSMTPDGRSKGNGIVVFVDHDGARAAIRMFNGHDFHGNLLEVREDRFATAPFRGGRGGFAGGFGRGGFAPRGAFGMRGAFRGGFAGGFGGGMGAGAGVGAGMGGGMGGGMGMGGRMGVGAGMGGAMGNAGMGMASTAAAAADTTSTSPDAMMGANGNVYGNGYYGGFQEPAAVADSGLQPIPAQPSEQILVRNLPLATTNEDLVELFETVGNVTLAEVLFEGEQSKGEGIVQMASLDEASEGGSRFHGYNYGGRPIDVQFSPQWHEFGANAARGGQVVGE